MQCLFSLYAYLSLTGTSYKIEDTTRDDSTNIKKNIQFVTVKPEYKHEFQAIYMLVGVGALISVFLFIIVIQLCKKSSSSRKRNRQSRDDNAFNNETLNQTNQRGYNIISEQFKDHSYRSFEDQYAEINESLEMDILNASSMQDNNGSFASLYLNSQPTDKFENTTNNITVHDMAEEMKADVDGSYLKPIFVQREPKAYGAKQEKVYINVDQD